MKMLFLILSFSLSLAAFAGNLKLCKANTPSDTTLEIKVLPSGNIIGDLAIEFKDGSIYEERRPVSIKQDSVRENLEEQKDLNPVEIYLFQAIAIENYSDARSGIKLKSVRAAKVYLYGNSPEVPSWILIEAYDGNGNELGSFLGGYHLAACE